MIFAFLEKTIKIKDENFSYKKKKDKSFKMEMAITNYVKQVNIVGFIKNDKSKSCLNK